MKRCCRCRKKKLLNDFYRHRSRKDGHTPYCKKCGKELEKTWKHIDRTKRHRERYQTDPIYNLNCRMRSLILFNVKRTKTKKTTKSAIMIGLSGKDLLDYLTGGNKSIERKFLSGQLHIDHIVPVTYFNRHGLYEGAHHYTNLRFLMEKKNRMKGNTISMKDREQILKLKSVIENLDFVSD